MARFPLEGLDCASCAMKLERALQKSNGLEQAKINFASSTLEVEPSQLARAEAIISSLEPEVRIITEQTVSAKKESAFSSFIRENGAVVRIGASLILALLGLVIRARVGQHALGQLPFLAAYFLVGAGVLKAAVHNALRGDVFDENALMSIATIGAIAIGQLPEAVAVMLFYSIGDLLQNHAVRRSRNAISALVKLRPEAAWVRRAGTIMRVSPEEVGLGEEIVVKAGERIPLDGVVLEGESFVDTSALTGESVPRRLSVGGDALAGMVSTSGMLVIKAEKPFGESAIARIMNLVEEAAGSKARTEKTITSFSRYYTPAVVALAAGIAIIPPLATGAAFATWLYRALVLLVISCPCALVISVPLGYFGGLGSASRHGVLVKGANYLDVLAKLQLVVFDKTGTLTEASFKVTEIHPASGFTQEDVLEPAAKVEAASNHPIASAVVAAFGKEVDPLAVTDFQEVSGFGIKGTLPDGQVVLGTDRFMHSEGIPHSEDVCQTTGTTVHVTVAGKYRGYLIIADQIKPWTAAALGELRAQGMDLVMLTGDDESVAQQVSKELKLAEAYAGLLPEEKVKKLERLKQRAQAGKVAFVGDGINDAPVLTRADVGIAMGALGSDAAIEAADVVIMDDNLRKLPQTIGIAKKTRQIVFQNIVFALGVKSLFMLLGAFGVSSIWMAVFADVGVTIIAVLNSLRTVYC